MNMWLILIVVWLVTVVVVTVIRFFMNRKAEHLKIIGSFGEIPEPKNILYAENYWTTYCETHNIEGRVDNHTWNNLDLNEVYQRINACWCEAGDALLYKRLRMQATTEDIRRQELLCRHFLANKELMYDTMCYLKRIGRANYHTMKTLSLTPDALDNRREKLTHILAVLPFCTLLIFPLHLTIGLLALLLSLALNFIATYIMKARNYSYQVAYPLSTLVYWSKKIIPLIEKCDPMLANQIAKCHAILTKIKRPFLFMRVSDYCEKIGIPDSSAFFLLPILSYYYVVRFAKKEKTIIAKLYDLVGEVDVACSVCSFRDSVPYWAEPQYIEKRQFSAKSIYHPLLEQAVANDIEVDKNVLLTGSNASGKSTFIKTVALNLILAQSCNTTCSRSLYMQKADVITAMAVSDNIFDGDSYFMAEIKAMKRLVQAVEQSTFCYLFIDEILRGTNTIERIAAAFSFLEYFSKANVLCLAASHDIELVAMTTPQYAQYHFLEYVENNEVFFSYIIHEGHSKTRNALKLLEIQDFPVSITEKAANAIIQFETEGTWI